MRTFSPSRPIPLPRSSAAPDAATGHTHGCGAHTSEGVVVGRRGGRPPGATVPLALDRSLADSDDLDVLRASHRRRDAGDPRRRRPAAEDRTTPNPVTVRSRAPAHGSTTEGRWEIELVVFAAAHTPWGFPGSAR